MKKDEATNGSVDYDRNIPHETMCVICNKNYGLHCGMRCDLASNGHHTGEPAKNQYWCRGKDDYNYFFPVNCTPEINHKSLLESNLKFCYNCGLDLKEDKSELLSSK